MARKNNYLLGRGESLTSDVFVPKKVDDKNPPYSFSEARTRIAERAIRADTSFRELPPAACPNDRVVAVVTLHPRYISKSEFPESMFRAIGVRAVGSRLRAVSPESWGIDKHPDEAPGEDVFVAGTRGAFARWSRELGRWTESQQGAGFIQQIEDLFAFRGAHKTRNLPPPEVEGAFEVVLHNAHDPRILTAFAAYARSLQIEPLVERQKSIKGLTFLPVRGITRSVVDLAEFAFVRVVRTMPSLRPIQPILRGSLGAPKADLPDEDAVDPSTRVLLLDGGLPDEVDLSRWVRLITPPEIGPPHPAYQDHGLAVTSAFLFGPIRDSKSLPTPLCKVDHVRVLDDQSAGSDLEYLDVLQRIDRFLANNAHRYNCIGLCLGPQMPIDDEEVTQWTACIDEHLAGAGVLAAVAVGNDGEVGEELGLNRIQPPADAVNALSVGACDTSGESWTRSPYSCVGPGRTPGIVKPDGVAFGGSERDPFPVLGRDLRLQYLRGTSLAAPYALRSAVAVRAQLGEELDALAIRALLIHRAEDPTSDSGLGREQVGWGRFPTHFEDLVTCDDDEVVTIFKGQLPVGNHLRVPIPVPGEPMVGNIEISATLVISPLVDPEHAGAYTRSGVVPCFRPHALRYGRNNGRRSNHPKSESFFSIKNMYSAAEFELRLDGQKWEPVLRSKRRKRSTSIHQPSFDFQYQHREGLSRDDQPKPIPYALIVSLRARRVPDLYNRVVRTYANVLVPITPRLRIPVRT